MKNLFSVLLLLLLLCGLSAVTLNAQPQTVRTISSAGATTADGHLSAVIGIPFSGRMSLGDYEVSLGVEQAHAVFDSVYGVITYNSPYLENDPPQSEYDFVLGPQTESHLEYISIVNGGIFHYDSVRNLFLIVCPQHIGDQANISYDVLAVSGHCWTKQNLRTPVEGTMAYTSVQTPTVPEEYGLLYTWQLALNGTAPDAVGYVQGICPAQNWHLPDATEIHDLMSNTAESLRSQTGWVIPNGNTNTTDFTAYPAGFYNPLVARFEGLGTQTDWWTAISMNENGALPTSLHLPYYCDTPQLIQRNPNDAISIRCVMKNVWPK